MQNSDTVQDTRPAFRGVRLLTAGYLALSVLTLVVAYVLRDTAAVSDAVWIRGGFVLLSAVVMVLSAASAARGSRRALRRVRILAAVMVVAIVVVVALPGLIPLWMKVEQCGCGLLLIGVVVRTRGGH